MSLCYIKSESKLESESGDESENVWGEEIKEGSTLMAPKNCNCLHSAEVAS